MGTREQVSNRYIQLLDIDVLTAAKERIKEIITSFDDYVIAFSGGKDSLVILNLVEDVKSEMGITTKSKVAFRDEEMIPDDVINFVVGIMESGKYDFRYYCVPLKSEKYVLGDKEAYIQWDADREHIRPIPPYAITSEKVMSQYEMDEYMCEGMLGKVAILTGIRAQESMVRMRSIVNSRRDDCYIAKTQSASIKLARPIYDWTQDDIFLYIYQKKIPYCSIYDAQIWNGDSLRVSTPLHAEAAKRLYKMKTLYPLFYQQMAQLYPDIENQARYYRDMDRSFIFESYRGEGFNGIIRYIDENIADPYENLKAKQTVSMCVRIRKKHIYKYPKTWGGYPVLYVLKEIVAGNYKRMILPCSILTPTMSEYEK